MLTGKYGNQKATNTCLNESAFALGVFSADCGAFTCGGSRWGGLVWIAFAVFMEGVGGIPPANMGWCIGFASPQATVKVAGVYLKNPSSLKYV